MVENKDIRKTKSETVSTHADYKIVVVGKFLCSSPKKFNYTFFLAFFLDETSNLASNKHNRWSKVYVYKHFHFIELISSLNRQPRGQANRE